MPGEGGCRVDPRVEPRADPRVDPRVDPRDPGGDCDSMGSDIRDDPVRDEIE